MTPQPTIDYQLLDCGDGRRLDQVGQVLVDRPAPTAEFPCRLDRSAWLGANARFERSGSSGRWVWRTARPESAWQVEMDGLTFEIRPATGGQIGIFPEQRAMWPWIAGQVERIAAQGKERPEVLHLFAFTGGATLAAARAGARVAHVDASRPAVAWARRNAELSGLVGRPVRWLVEDATTFARRELRRGRSYDGVVLDPPSYGHGPAGRAWRLHDRLPELLELVASLVAERRGFVVLTAHTTDLGPDDLRRALLQVLERRCESGLLGLIASSGARLTLGAYARVAAGPG